MSHTSPGGGFATDAVFSVPTPTYSGDAVSAARRETVTVDGAHPGELEFYVGPELPNNRLARGYMHDFYYRIWVIPDRLVLGAVVSDRTEQITVWNAYPYPVNVESSQIVNAGNLTHETPEAEPYDLTAMQLVEYTINIPKSGPAFIKATFALNTEVGQELVEITGSRAVPWLLSMNWRNGVDETLKFLTAVEQSYDGTEQRSEIRDIADRGIEYTAHWKQREAAIADSILFGRGNAFFAVPMWPEKMKLISAVTAGAASISVDSLACTVPENGGLLIYKNAQEYEALTISEVVGNAIALSGNVQGNWPAETAVYPLCVFRLDGNVASRRLTDSVVEAKLSFIASGADTDPNLPEAEAPATYLDQEIYTGKTNWDNGLNADWSPEFEAIEPGPGIVNIQKTKDFTSQRRQHKWMLKGRTEIKAFREFIGRRRGRAVGVWMPTHFEDLKLLASIIPTSNVVDVRDDGYLEFVDLHPARQHILLKLKDGTLLPRKILTATPNGDGVTRFTVEPVFPDAVSPDDVLRFSFLGFYRFASDDVTLSWKTTTVATVEAVMQLVKPA